MRKTIILILGLAMCNAAHTHAQTWVNVGSPYFSADGVSETTIDISSSGTVYVGYSDYNDLGKMTVMKYSGTSWTNVGAPAFSAGPAYYPKVVLAPDNTPYVVYKDISGPVIGKATVKKFSGSSWTTVGTLGFSDSSVSYTDMAFNSTGTPYVVFQDDSNDFKATVMKFNGTAWTAVGSKGFSAGQAEWTSIAIDGSGNPYVAYEDFANGHGITVMKFNGSNWTTVGASGFTYGSQVTLAIGNTGTPYVSFSNDSNYATVRKFNGTSWVNVGTPAFSDSTVRYPAITMNNDTPYVTYADFGHNEGTTVMKYNGSNWVNVGNKGFSPTHIQYSTIAIHNNVPYVAYRSLDNNDGAIVMKLSSAASGIVNTGNAASSLSVFPQPNHGSFTMNIAVSGNEDAKVSITNMLGEPIKEWTAAVNSDVQVRLNVPAGLYFITAITAEGSYSSRIVVQ